MKRLLIDFKENCNGEIVGRVSHSEDSVFVLEALALAIAEFAKSCEVPSHEIVKDIERILSGGVKQ